MMSLIRPILDTYYCRKDALLCVRRFSPRLDHRIARGSGDGSHGYVRSERSSRDFGHRRGAAAELAEFELSLLDLLCQLDATDHTACRAARSQLSDGAIGTDDG
jgi:hypothetical protein